MHLLLFPFFFPFFGFGFLPFLLIGLFLWFGRGRSGFGPIWRGGGWGTGFGPQPVPPQLSSDANWWWDGNRWVSAVSADGQWRWDGTSWQPNRLVVGAGGAPPPQPI